MNYSLPFIVDKSTMSLLVFLFVTSLCQASGHGLVKEIPLADRLESSTLVVEAEVVSERAFWDVGRKSIFTAYTLHPITVFKGQLSENIELVKRGGFIGLEGMIETPSLEMATGDVGIFLLSPSGVVEEGQTSAVGYQGVAGPLSMLKQNQWTKQYADEFDFYGGQAEITRALTSATGRAAVVVESRENIVPTLRSASVLPITSISPTSIIAGALDQLTITGSGFGANPGLAFFANANSGGQTFSPAQPYQIISWSDTQVVVEVPNQAGTGPVGIQTSAGENILSSQILQIDYALTSVFSNFGGVPSSFNVQHANTDGNGGYVWQMYTGFASNTPAVEAFERALETWSCTSGINWEIGANTNVDTIASDGVNVVRFDIGTELNGPIGVCTSYYGGCGNGQGGIEWYVSELDIVFDTATNWNFGPNPTTGGAIDFESVALHELGHGHQLGHVIDPGGDVMHYIISNATDLREPNANNTTGSNVISARGVSGSVCNFPAMVAIECGPSACPGDFNSDNTVNIDDFLSFSSDFGSTCTCPTDLNGNGVVNVDDFLIFSSLFGSVCE